MRTTIIADMLRAMAQVEALGKPVTERRVHPDDYAALRDQAKLYVPDGTGPLTSFNGIKIVLDEDAPRVPRA